MNSWERKIILPEKLLHAQSVLLILSGGMDSGVLLQYLYHNQKQVHALSFDYGSKHNSRELAAATNLAKQFAASHTIIPLPFFLQFFQSSLLQNGNPIPDGHYADESMKQTVVPFRNGIFLSIAAGFAESKKISLVLLGSHAGDHSIYPDCRPEFTIAFSEAVRLGTYPNIEVYAPFSNLDKREIAQIGHALNFDFTATYTCYKGGEKHCGTCGACQERKYALDFDKGLDPTSYFS